MAIISNFELLFKPIAPQGGPATEVARVVVQGYFLTISNLESRDIKLTFRTRTNIKEPADSVNTEFTNTNNVVAYDITQDNLINTQMVSFGPLIPDKQAGHYVQCLRLPAGQTASLAVLPNIQGLLSNPNGPSFDLAIRGYTELVLGSDESARILVTPEHRGTFLDPEFDFTNNNIQTGLDFDQLAYSLPTANGKALQEITTYANFDDPFLDLVAQRKQSPFGSSFFDDPFLDLVAAKSRQSPFGSSLRLSTLSKNLSKDANAPTRETTFKLGTLPIRIDYSIKQGKYVVEEKSLIKFLGRKLKSADIDPKSFAKTVNLALAGDEKADDKVLKWFESLKL